MLKSLRVFVFTLAFGLPQVLLAQETGFLDRSVTVNGANHPFQVYIPRGYDGSQQWPVILFLHGAGERGDDGLKQTQVGLGRAIRLNPERWPAIGIFPQMPASESWQGDAGRAAMIALDATMQEFTVDSSRQYLTGLSLGGNGTWYLGYQYTERFAALVAVCGFVGLGDSFPAFLPETSSGPYRDLAVDLAAKSVWIVHGDADSVVPVDESRKMVEALQGAGAEVHYTELPGVGHNAWDAAYSNEELIDWLFEQRID
ncbi:MAG TPA: prolyl oligopeptidase family serine peptidase [Gammaproteobacteria bacterium]|jgi:predicted peptidase|nr:prolyl oligopeptidase family serine peptidase [Gammaproteobacteria bacterium]|tara:strand:- start:1518 stop:2288 length:771 start_codon:yes stop_codon:yes gene_type:complete